MIDRCARYSTRIGSRVRLLGIVLTMVDDRSRHVRSNIQRLRDTFPRDVFAVEVRQAAKVAEAPDVASASSKQLRSTEKHRAANAFRLLADEVLQRMAAYRYLDRPRADLERPAPSITPATGALRTAVRPGFGPAATFEPLGSDESTGGRNRAEIS